MQTTGNHGWKRGHPSKNGVVTAIIGKSLVDYKVLSKFCTGCFSWEEKAGTPEYDEWKAKHICDINHEGSSGSMESEGAVEIFKRSVEKHNIILFQVESSLKLDLFFS